MPQEQRDKIAESLRAKGRGNTPTKRCPQCGNEYPRESFGRNAKGFSYPYCKACSLDRSKFFAKKSRDRRRVERQGAGQWHVPESRKSQLLERVMSRTSRVGSGCILWLGAMTNGYGVINFDHGIRRTHRVVWECVKGEIPDGAMLDHICGNRACQSVDHMRVVDVALNAENLVYARSNSRTGHRNVSWVESIKKYRVEVTKSGRTRQFGQFKDLDEAVAAARAARKIMFTHSNREPRFQDG
jgi:hypothetical protein